MQGFSGINAYIFGGSSGIGLAVALDLARQGANLCLLARRPEALSQARDRARNLAERPGQRVECWGVDVTDPGLTQAVLSDAARELGAPDLVINCAGRAVPRQLADLTPQNFADTLRLNLQGTFHVAAAAWPLMKPGGHLVNVASLAGLVGVYGYGDYCAAKFGVVGFSQALRCELAPLGIGVSVLCPGDTDTPGYREEDRAKPALTRALSAHAGLMRPEEVAKALLAGLRRGKFLIVPGLRAKLIAAAQRHLPGLAWRVVLRDLRKAGAPPCPRA